MKSIMAAKSPHDSSFSFSRRYFHWKKKALYEDDEEKILNISSSSHFSEDDNDDVDGKKEEDHHNQLRIQMPIGIAALEKNKNTKSKFKSALTILTKNHSQNHRSRTHMVGTLFGYRRGHVHFAFQEDSKLSPAFLIELATPTSVLVREMASGVVRIALECEQKSGGGGRKGLKLLAEPIWRTYCNGRKCGYAYRHECGSEEWRILRAVEPITMGAGVLPMPSNENGAEFEGEIMYMRAKYERVVGSKDSQAFYMLNPAGSGGPELSIYLLRV
ncbi:protein MIZU-KUSSEI 1-like [Vicia villosa]|uniref:protein MIZU-KUSSEI 1-like n=1 Tax=Vicia villosa TaxID=3911 RepID=UPI00273AC776|nr:protein MIZU-KUSSEI 1-like [Vicia villosa]